MIPAQRRVLATVTGAQVLSVASATSIAVALPDIRRDLGAGATELQWIVDAFVLVFASLLVAGGVAADRHGRRTALLVGLALFALGSLWCLVAPSVEWLIAGRVVQALGPPLALPATLAIVTATFAAGPERARAVGLWGAGSGVGLALGPLLGGLIVEAVGWRWVFGVNVPVAALLMGLTLRGVARDRPARAEAPFDAAAAVLLTVTVGLLVFALIEGRGLGWGSAEVLGALLAAAALGGAFVRRERRHPAPLVDLGLLRQRTFFAANLGGATMFGALTGSAIYVSVFLQQVQDRTALEAGLCLLPQGALTAAFAPVAGRLTTRYGPRLPILLGMSITTVAFLALLTLEAGTSLAQVWWMFALVGVGTGLSLPAMTVVALGAARVEQAGMASAIHNASRQLGQTFAVAILGTIIFARAGDAAEESELTGAISAAFVDGLHLALLVTAAGLAVVAAAVSVLIARTAPAGENTAIPHT